MDNAEVEAASRLADVVSLLKVIRMLLLLILIAVIGFGLDITQAVVRGQSFFWTPPL